MKYVLKTTKQDSAETFNLGPNNTEKLDPTELNDDKFFPISAREADQYLGSESLKTPGRSEYWLRSPIFGCMYIMCVTLYGEYSFKSPDKMLDTYVRLAFNLDLSSVLFTSKAEGGKAVKVGAISEIKETANFNEYKLTMKDTERTFTVSEDQVNVYKDGAVSLNYENAKSGTNEYVSVIILDKKGNAEYYGQLANITNDSDSSGKIDFTVPTNLDYGSYTMYLFNEQLNGDCNTDFSSAFQTVTLNVVTKPEPTASDFTFKAPNNLIYDGTPKTATVTTSKVGMGNIKAIKYYDKGDNKVDAPINAGQYSVKIDVEEGSGYAAVNDLTSSGWNFEITKADTEISADNITVTYGDKLTLTANVEKSKSKVADTDKVDFYVGKDDDAVLLGTAKVQYSGKYSGTATLEINTGGRVLEIGENTITAEYGGNINLNGSKNDAITVNLKQKEVGLLWSGYSTRPYDGTKASVTATATGIENNDGEISVTVTGGDKINANPGDMYYVATATALIGDNSRYYKLPANNAQFYRIEQIDAQIEWSDKLEFTYDGNEKEVTATVKNLVSGDTANLVLFGNTGVDVNSYTAEVATIDNSNYTLNKSENLKKHWSITPASDNEITNLFLSGWTYGDTANTPTATAKYGTPIYSYSNSKDGIYTESVPTTPGTYWVKAYVAKTKNYAEGISSPFSFTISKATPTENKQTTARVQKGRTLADATVAYGEMLDIYDKALDGTFAWADDTAEIISADCTKIMTFTPFDVNYAPITFAVEVSTYTSGGGGGSVTSYTAKFDTDGGNTITSQTVTRNGKIIEPKEPTKDGYIFDGWYTDSKLTSEYDFDTKVTKNIILYAKWVEDEVQEPSDDKKDDEQKPNDNNADDESQTKEWKNPFTDVKENDWFFDNVRYVNENGLMSGMTNTEFAPSDTLTRGMLVTILYRLAGEPVVNKSIPFADVTSDSYYANAVIWAEQNGIVSGINETEFAPDENITREQIAVILYRYAKAVGYDVSVGEDTNILSYDDFEEISEYAIEAVQYAVGSGLMNGKTEKTLNPKDFATRAEIATILNRFIEGNK